MKNKKICTSIILMVILFVTTPYISVNAESYNYDFWGQPIPSTEGLTYKTTYYDKDLKAADGSDEKIEFSGNIQNMTFYNDSIFVLDGRKDIQTSIPLPEGDVSVGSASILYVFNTQMEWTQKIGAFKFAPDRADELLEHLSDVYNYHVDYMDVTAEHLNKAYLSEKAPYAAVKDGQNNWVPGLYLTDAQGIAVTEKGIYIADSENSRIIRLNEKYEVTDVFLRPDDETFLQFGEVETETSKRKYRPIKIAVDRTGRVYVIAQNAYAGILEYNNQGDFNRYLGKNVVTVNAWQAFLSKWFYTEEQLQARGLNLPPLFNNIAIDSGGFLFTTSEPLNQTDLNTIKKINTSGKDVLKRNGYNPPSGDQVWLSSHFNRQAITGTSIFNAIAVNSDGIYTALDRVRGRLFTYDDEGNLLYVAGEKGTSSSTFNNPTALCYVDVEISENITEQYLYVLDKGSRSILAFQTTEFGKLVNEATSLYLNTNAVDMEKLGYDPVVEAAKVWEEVLRMDSNYGLAYVGIGKSQLRQGDYEKAMENFKKGQNATYYSKAFQLYRDNILRENFNLIMTGAILTVTALACLVIIKNINKRSSSIKEEIDE